VVRFCRTLGYDGWHEFKLKLAQGLALALPGANEQPAQDDLAADLVNKICSRSINTLLDLRNNLNPELIQKALDILSRANKIEFYGQGTSGIVAADAQHKFFRSGVPTVAYTDPATSTAIAAALLREGDAVVAISQRGNNPALVRSAKLARRGGAEVIVLAPSGTPLADMASLLIPIDLVFATDPYTPISARLAYLVVIDVLAVGLALQRGPEFRKKMQNAQKALQEFDMQFDSSRFIGVPQVAVDVLEALVVHEAMVLGRVRRAAAGSDGPGDERVDFLPAFAAQADDDFIGFLCLCDGLADQGLEERLGRQHGLDGVADDIHECRVLAAEFVIEREAERGKEGFGFVQVFYG
jgi:RpiR family carbohydrate utilization transcriptional regulator